jgi:simple sugar transport system ATP-binding protein
VSEPAAIRLQGVSKRFGTVWANRDVTVDVRRGAVHGLLGENGAGKSTLMKILFGMVRADGGRIEIDGAAVEFRSSADALSAGIGMVQQHFSLIPSFTVVENLVMGRGATHPLRRWMAPLDITGAAARVRELSDRFGFGIDPLVRCGDLSVGARQKVEILKALWGGARILVLDEPTAALAPPEAEELYRTLERLRGEDVTIVLISHKLPEVLRLCDRVTILRDGEVAGEVGIAAADRLPGARRDELEAGLVRMMIGRAQPQVPGRATMAGPVVLAAREIGDGARLGPLDLEVRAGEILAVVGVEGNGQRELVDVLTGARPTAGGAIWLDGSDITELSTARRLASGIAHIPEDRHANAIADEMSVVDNASFGFSDGAPLARSRFWLSRARRTRFADLLVERQRVRLSSVTAPIQSLSGGNQQKLVVARELARAPRLLIAAQPTRGLDIAATTAVHEALLALRDSGAAVLLLSLDLTEVFAMADRIVVLRMGRIVGESGIADADPDRIGSWMTGASDTRVPVA